VPYVLGDGVDDELVPVSSVLQQVNTFLSDGNRIHFELYPAEDHLVFATQDGFSNEIAQLGTTTRVVNPPHITYTWYPVLQDRKLGLGPTGDYWVRGIAGRVKTVMATVDVTSNAIPNPPITAREDQAADVPGDPTPALVVDNTWQLGKDRPTRRTARMTLTNVATVGIDMARARLRGGGVVTVRTDGPTLLRLLDLVPGATVRQHGKPVHVDGNGTAVLRLAKGTHVVSVT
jgi:hypothetical protein